MILRPDRPALPLVILAALEAAPGVGHEGADFLIQRVADRDLEAVAVHRVHLVEKILAVVGAVVALVLR